jgi:hypothetical protein
MDGQRKCLASTAEVPHIPDRIAAARKSPVVDITSRPARTAQVPVTEAPLATLRQRRIPGADQAVAAVLISDRREPASSLADDRTPAIIAAISAVVGVRGRLLKVILAPTGIR